MKRIFLVTSVFVLAFSLFSLTSRAQETGEPEEAPTEKGVFNTAIMTTMKLDMENSVVAMWWTGEMWAAMAYDDKTNEALMTYRLVSSIMDDYLLFTVGNLGESETKDAKLDGQPILENDKGVRAKAMAIHKSLSTFLPNFMAIPARDAKGKKFLTADAKKLKLTVKSADTGKTLTFDWDLPVAYAQEIIDAKKQVESTKPPADTGNLTEDDLMYSYLSPTMRADLENGFIAFYVSPELLKMMIKNKVGKMADPDVRPLVEKVINSSTCFMVMEPADDKQRLAEALKTAKLIMPDGKSIAQDIETYEKIKKAATPDKDKAIDIIVFPKIIGSEKVKLAVKAPDTGKTAIFVWKSL